MFERVREGILIARGSTNWSSQAPRGGRTAGQDEFRAIWLCCKQKAKRNDMIAAALSRCELLGNELASSDDGGAISNNQSVKALQTSIGHSEASAEEEDDGGSGARTGADKLCADEHWAAGVSYLERTCERETQVESLREDCRLEADETGRQSKRASSSESVSSGRGADETQASTGEYQAEREYFSDPDYHDVRPGKGGLDPRQIASFDSKHPVQRTYSTESRDESERGESSQVQEASVPDESSCAANGRKIVQVGRGDSVREQLQCLQEQTAREARPEPLVDEDLQSALGDAEVSSSCGDEERELSDSIEQSERSRVEVGSGEPPESASSSCKAENDATSGKYKDLLSAEKSEQQVEAEVEGLHVAQGRQEDVGLTEKRGHLMELVADYCDQLVEIIKSEAFERVEQVLKSQQVAQIDQLSLAGTLETNFGYSEPAKISDQPMERAESEQGPQQVRSSESRIYSSSLFYDDKRDSYPTLDEQVARCQTIAKQLTATVGAESDGCAHVSQSDVTSAKLVDPSPGSDVAPVSSESRAGRASRMFWRRRERMRQFTFSSSSSFEADERHRHADSSQRTRSISDASSSEASRRLGYCSLRGGAATDTEYEAPGVRLPRGQEEDERVVSGTCRDRAGFKSRYRPYLDPTMLKDIERLKNWSPRVDFNQHANVPPELCQKLAADLRTLSATNRGSKMFEQRQMHSSDWVVAGEEVREASEVGIKEQASRPETGQSLDELPPLPPPDSPLGQGAKPQGGCRLSRPSISESTVMVVESECPEQLVELAPVVSSHSRPKLELAKVTKTPSFSASSRRIVECDSEESSSGPSLSPADSTASLPVDLDGETSAQIEAAGESSELVGRAAGAYGLPPPPPLGGAQEVCSQEVRASLVSGVEHLDEHCHQPSDVHIEHRAAIMSRARPISHRPSQLHRAQLISCPKAHIEAPQLQYAREHPAWEGGQAGEFEESPIWWASGRTIDGGHKQTRGEGE